MTFAWYGFGLEHPDDWAPIAISGGRKEGYVRISSPDVVSYQLRWKESKGEGDLKDRLFAYLRKLQSGRQEHPFESHWEREEDRIVYRWTGPGQGRGLIFYNAPCSRVFILEAIGERKSALMPHYRQLTDSFSSQPAEQEAWSAFGLSLSLPAGMDVEKKVFLSGRTTLGFRKRKAHVEAERWAFGAQLVAQSGLAEWAASALDLSGALREDEDPGVRLRRPKAILKPEVEAIARLDEPSNQLLTLKTWGGDDTWRPRWDWLN